MNLLLVVKIKQHKTRRKTIRKYSRTRSIETPLNQLKLKSSHLSSLLSKTIAP